MATMFSRRRLTDALTLERSERGALVIANIDDMDGANQKLREGDEVVGATIKFDQLSKEEVMGVLKLMEPYDDRIQVLTRNNMSKSMGNLDQLAVSPEMMLHDSYSKLYNAKIKRFMRKDSPDGENPRDFVQTLPHAARRKTKRDSDLPRLGVDFGRLSPSALVRRFSAGSETGHAAYTSGAFAQGANLNLPPLGVGQVKAGRRVQVPQQLNNGGRSQAGLVSGIYDNGDDVDAAMALRDTDGRYQTYRLSNGDAEFDVDGYDISPTMHLAGPSSRLNAPRFDLDGRSARWGARGSAFDVDGPSGDFDVKAPGIRGDFTASNPQLQGVSAPIPAVRSKVPPGKYKAPKFSMPKFGLPTVEVPDFDGDLPGMDISSPDVRLSKPNIRGLNTTDWSLKSPKIEGAFDGPDLDLKGAGLEMDAPKMPKSRILKFSRPNLKGPELDGHLDGLDMDIDAPKFKLDGPSADFGMPDYDLDDPNLDFRSPDLDISGPDLRGGVSAPDLEMPRFGLKSPKLDLKSPNLDMPSGKLNMPDLNLKAPKFKGGLDGPDLDADLKAPKLDLNLPKAKVNLPKTKIPKFGRPSLKGPAVDADLDGLDMDAKAPKLKLKGPKADLGMPMYHVVGPNPESDLGIEVEFEYPFRLHQVYFDAPTCKGGNPERLFLVGDYSSSAEFFVTIGVFSFLYSMAALSLYCFVLEKYRENNKGPQIDFVVTAVFAFMWLVSSCAWAKGLSDVKTATDPERVITLITSCNEQENRCREVYDPKVSGLNTSVAFGFINLILWIGNLWFVFKETGWMAAFAGTYMPSQEKQPAPDSFAQGGDYGQQDPYAGSQGGYQPEYGQQGGYNEDGGYSQGYEQQPTSYSNQM